MSPTPERDRSERGQILALFAIGSIAIIAMVGLVVDGGNAWAQERWSQNGTDAAAFAGTTVLAERLGGESREDSDVLAAVNTIAADMEVTVQDAVYTYISGEPMSVPVGDAVGNEIPAQAAGVAVTGERQFGTYFARVLGLDTLTAVTEATAITGEIPPPGRGVLPVTPPINVVACDGQNRPWFPPEEDGGPVPYTVGFYKIPLCQDAAGNVGWIDWTPPAGGASELTSCIRDPINTPGCNEGITVPKWYYVSQTGNPNSVQVESALREWNGKVVYIPLFDDTCTEEPVQDPDTGEDKCDGGNGQQNWYHFVGIGAFELCGGEQPYVECGDLEGSYLTGQNSVACEPVDPDAPRGSGGTSCLIGRFVEGIYDNTTVGPLYNPGELDYASPTTFIGIQLVR